MITAERGVLRSPHSTVRPSTSSFGDLVHIDSGSPGGDCSGLTPSPPPKKYIPLLRHYIHPAVLIVMRRACPKDKRGDVAWPLRKAPS